MIGLQYDPVAAGRALAAQRERDAVEAARDALKPDFETGCAIAKRRREAREKEAKENPQRVVLPPETSIDPGVSAIVPPLEMIADWKANKRRMEKHEAAALFLQTFIGPRTPQGKIEARELHAWHVEEWKKAQAHRLTLSPLVSEIRAASRSFALPPAIAAFLDESEQDTGMSLSVEEYAKQQNAKSKLKEMSAEICRRLELAGVQTKREDDCGLWVYWIHSQVWEQIDQYRRICINPLVAASSRSTILASLEYYLQRTPFCRFWTFTTGPRCLTSEIPGRLDVYFRKLSKLNHVLKKKWGAEIVITTTEFGTLENEATGPDDDEQGRITFEDIRNEETGLHTREPVWHPHFHTVVRSTKGYRSKAEWKRLCSFVRSYWGAKVLFDGCIRSAREVVKYVTKPGDLLKLTPEQLRAFYEATANRRLVRPMGSLRKEIAERKNRPVKTTLRRIRVGAGRWEWVERVDHNQTFQDCIPAEDRRRMDEIIDAEVFAAQAEAAARAQRVCEVGETLTIWDDGETQREAAARVMAGEAVRLKDKPTFCQVVAFIPPAAGPCRRKENRVIVMGNIRDEKAVLRHPLVRQMRDRTYHAWHAGEALAGAESCFADLAEHAAPISVHTGTVTVPDEFKTSGGWRVDDALQLVMETT